MNYLHDKDEAYAIEITNLHIFKTPLTPDNIEVPQSYKYIDYDL